MSCELCPKNCKVDRAIQAGYCGCTAVPRVASVGLHHFEEPPISGSRGSGAIFFAGCNLRCCFCQNHVLWDATFGQAMDEGALCNAMLRLQSIGAHNINLVTPTPHIATLALAIKRARAEGLELPIVYNTNSYISPKALDRLNGLVDIYLPDIKYKDSRLSKRFSNAEDYFSVAIRAIELMFLQVGQLSLDSQGLAKSGVLIRHLVLPGCGFDTRDIMDELVERFSCSVHLSLMRQYTPLDNLKPPLNRTLTDREYELCVAHCQGKGMDNVFLQDKSSCGFQYRPNFKTSLEL